MMKGNTMAKNVVIIFGGPRKESNTHILVKEAQKGLADYGAESEIFFLNDPGIKGCRSCNYCKANDTTDCAVKDDMQKAHRAMEKSDGVIVATPVYLGNVTAQTKTWIDRLYCYAGPGHAIPGGKRIAFIFTQNHPDEHVFKDGIGTFMTMTKLAGFVPAGHLQASNPSKGAKPNGDEEPRLPEGCLRSRE
jgi:multimeric flavodoxin WrbA